MARKPIYRPSGHHHRLGSVVRRRQLDANCITLLRGTKADGTPELRTVFLDTSTRHLASPRLV